MRGQVSKQSSLLMLASVEDRIAADHPLRKIKRLADEALGSMSAAFDDVYASTGRASIPPERLLKSQLLIALYSIRSDRQFCEQLEYNLLFRWFVDMAGDEEGFDHSVFSKNRERLMRIDAANAFFAQVVRQAKHARLLSAEHFSVDGTLIQAWASMKSFRPKNEPRRDDDDHNGWGDFTGQKRSNETHESTTDPEAKLMRKSHGQEARLSFAAHALMDNKHGLLVDFRVTQASGRAEREAAAAMLESISSAGRRVTLGADKAYDAAGFVGTCRAHNVTPHIAARARHSAIDGRTKRHRGYGVSLIKRRLIEPALGWIKAPARFARSRFRGIPKTAFAGMLYAAAFNLLRMARLVDSPAAA